MTSNESKKTEPVEGYTVQIVIGFLMMFGGIWYLYGIGYAFLVIGSVLVGVGCLSWFIKVITNHAESYH